MLFQLARENEARGRCPRNPRSRLPRLLTQVSHSGRDLSCDSNRSRPRHPPMVCSVRPALHLLPPRLPSDKSES